MADFTLRQIDEMDAVHRRPVKLAAAELGVNSFGMQVLDLPPGFADYPEHDHADDEMEEVYVVLSGCADFEIDGERVPIDNAGMLRVGASVKRKLHPGRDDGSLPPRSMRRIPGEPRLGSCRLPL